MGVIIKVAIIVSCALLIYRFKWCATNCKGYAASPPNGVGHAGTFIVALFCAFAHWREKLMLGFSLIWKATLRQLNKYISNMRMKKNVHSKYDGPRRRYLISFFCGHNATRLNVILSCCVSYYPLGTTRWALPLQQVVWGISCLVLLSSFCDDSSLFISFSNNSYVTAVTPTSESYRNLFAQENHYPLGNLVLTNIAVSFDKVSLLFDPDCRHSHYSVCSPRATCEKPWPTERIWETVSQNLFVAHACKCYFRI